MTDDPRMSATNEMVEAALDTWFGHKLWRASPDHDDRTREQFERMTRSIEAALALDPLRQPVAGDIIAVAMDAFNSTTDFGEAIDRTITAADRARGFAGMAGVEWRRPEEFIENPSRWVMATSCGEGSPRITCIRSHWSGDTLHPWIAAWAEMPEPPEWTTQSPERRSDDAPRDAPANATTHDPGVAALAGGATDLPGRLRSTTRLMANVASVPMDVWNTHSNTCLESADEIDRLRATCTPGRADLMVSPESLDKFMADNPLR